MSILSERFEIITHQEIFVPEKYFPQCHASTIERLPGGELCAAWFAGSKEGNDDVAIYTSVRGESGWSEPVRAADFEGAPCWNPVLFWDGAQLQLYYKAGKPIAAWKTFRVYSQDGTRWSEPEELVPGDESGGRGPVKNKLIRLENGTLCAPASTETPTEWDSFADISADNGRTWSRSEYFTLDRGALEGEGIIQPTFWQDGGTVFSLARSTEGCLYRSFSKDGGRTWSEAVKTVIPNNNSGVDAARHHDGRVFLIYNPVSGNWGHRREIHLGISENNGEALCESFELETVESGELSYPAIIIRGGEIYITYTHRRRSVAFWHLRVK